MHPDGCDFSNMMKVCNWMDDFSDTDNKEISDEESDSSYWGPDADDDRVYDLEHAEKETENFLELVDCDNSPKEENQKKNRTSKKRTTVSVVEAWKNGFFETHTKDDSTVEQWVHSCLKCDKCCFGTGMLMLSIPEDNCLSKLASTNAWFEHAFITSYCGMVAHRQHREDIIVMHSMYMNQKIVECEVYELPSTVKTLYSILWSNGHFVVMECHIETHQINIYDGYTQHTSVTDYALHVTRILMRCSLIPVDTNEDFLKDGSDSLLTFSDTSRPWCLHGPLVFVKQDDGHSCGPISCFQIMCIFGRLPQQIKQPFALSLREIRKIVIEDFSNLMDELQDEIRVNIPRKRQRKDFARKTVADALAAARQDRKAVKEQLAVSMMKQQITDVKKRSAKLGSIVSISQSTKDETHGRGLIGVVFAVSVYGGCCVVTKQGIIGYEKGVHWIPVDRYKALPDDMPIEENLRKIRAGILDDEFEPSTMKKISLVTAFRLEYETEVQKHQATSQTETKDDFVCAVVTCRCKKGCTRRCNCLKKESGCGPSCACEGRCDNKFNNPL
jgi:hypothetical protein